MRDTTEQFRIEFGFNDGELPGEEAQKMLRAGIDLIAKALDVTGIIEERSREDGSEFITFYATGSNEVA